MPIDRGELRYNIRLTTGNTFQNLRKFRKEIAAGRREFRAFRDDLRVAARDSGEAGRGLDRVATGLERINKQTSDRQLLTQTVTDAKKARRAFGLIVSELIKIRKELKGIRTDARRSASEVQKVGRNAERAASRGTRGFKRLRREMAATRTGADRLASSFLRMGGIISGFLIARSIIGGIRALIEESIEFNRTIERAELGISAILIAVGEVRGAFGATVGQVEQLSLAENEARKQLEFLRRDALSTAATFKQLADTFQIALAPGLAAGLDVDEVRRFTLRISQAALALGVAQNQLSEEIRSILSGTIRPQTTRIAVALGITNEQIRRARELGQLATFLEDRFSAFGVAGQKALDTIDGLLGRVKDGFGQVAGEAARSVGFFDNVKDVLRDTLDLFLDFDEFGFPQPDPKTLEVLQTFFQRINEGLELLRTEFEAVTFDQAVEAARDLADAVIATVQIVIGAVQGLGDAFGFLAKLIREVASLLGFADGEQSIKEIARVIVGIFTVLITIKAVLGTIFGILGPLAITAKVLFTTFSLLVPVISKAIVLLKTGMLLALTKVSGLAWNTALAFAKWPVAIQSSIAALGRFAITAAKISAVIAGAILAFREAIRVFTGISLDLEETLLTLAASIERIFLSLAKGFVQVGAGIFNFFANTVNAIAEKILDPFLERFVETAIIVADRLNQIGAISDDSLKDFIQTATTLRDIPFRITPLDANKADEIFRDAFEQNDALFAEIEKRNRERTARDEEEERKRQRAAEETGDAVVDGFEKQEKAAESLLDVIRAVTAQFSTARTAIQEVSTASDRLQKALVTLDLQDQFARDPQVSGLAGQIQNASQREQITLGRELLNINRQREQIERSLVRVSRSREASERTLVTFTKQQQEAILGVDRAIVKITELRKREEELVTSAALARAEEREALQRGATEEILAARKVQSTLNAQLDLIKEQRTELEGSVNQIQERGVLDEDALNFLKNRLEVLSREVSLTKDLKLIKDTIRNLEEQSLEFQRRNAEQQAQRTLNVARFQEDRLRNQATLLRDINQLEARGDASGAAIRLRQLQAQTQELKTQAVEERVKILLQIQSLQATIEQTGATRETNSALFEQLSLLQDQLGLQKQITEEELIRQKRREERQRILSEGTAGESARLGVEDFINQIGTIQEQLSQLTTNLLNTFSQGVTNALVNSLVTAFDEAGKFSTEVFLENLRLAAAQLLQTIAQQLLQTAINNLISALLQAIFGSAAITVTAATEAAAIEQTSAGLAATTKVTAATTAAGIELAAAKAAAAIRAVSGGLSGGTGLAAGGYVSPNLPQSAPPRGIPSSDRVSAFLTPEEYVQPVSAVHTYGLEVMEAMRNRLIDPGLLKSLVGTRKLSRLQRLASKGPGYAAGGSVQAEQAATSSLNAELSSLPDSGGGAGAPIAAIPIDNVTFEQQLAAGKAAFTRYLRDNARDFDGALRGGRTGG